MRRGEGQIFPGTILVVNHGLLLLVKFISKNNNLLGLLIK